MPHSLFSDLWAIPPHMAEELLRTLHGHTHPSPQGAAHPPSSLAPGAALVDPADNTPEAKGYTVEQGVAVIPISGLITRNGYRSWWSGELVSHGQDTIRAAVESALADATVRGILFSINSPGGVVPGIKELADYVAEAATRKPCAAYADGLMASAAYWLASATGCVYAPATANVGSIGIIMTHTDWSKWNEKAGLAVTTISSGQWKAAGSPDRPMTEAERAYFQQRISATHGIFTADVRTRMGLTAPEAAWAEAQIYLAGEAVQHGLVTALVRDLPEAIATIAKETLMDKATLAAQHPDLLAQIQTEAKAEARQEAEAQSHARMQSTLTVVKSVAGEQTFGAIKGIMEMCAAAGLNPEQMQALAPVLAQQHVQPDATAAPAPPVPTGELAAMQKIMADLQKASTQPLAADPKAAPTDTAAQPSPLVANAEARAAASGAKE